MMPGGSSSLLYGAPAARLSSGQLSIDERHMLSGGTISRDPGGTVARFKDDEGHCDFGPALEFPSGRKLYMRNGRLHREDGPAIDGEEGFPDSWFIEGIQIAPPAPGEMPGLPEPVDIEVEPLRGKHEKRRTRLILKVPVYLEGDDFDTAKHAMDYLEECGYTAVIVAVDEAENETAVDSTSVRKGRVPMDATAYLVYTAEKVSKRR